MGDPATYPLLPFPSRAAWWDWLAEHHASSDGVLIHHVRAGVPIPSVTAKEAVEVALCWGWIDGQTRSLDAQRWQQRFTPRRPRSMWSLVNRAKALELIERGEMQPPGLAEVQRAQADGRWDAAYSPPSTAQIPEDLQAALDADPVVAAGFAGLDGRNRFAILHRLETAVRPETRARRLAKFVEMLRRGERLYGS